MYFYQPIAALYSAEGIFEGVRVAKLYATLYEGEAIKYVAKGKEVHVASEPINGLVYEQFKNLPLKVITKVEITDMTADEAATYNICKYMRASDNYKVTGATTLPIVCAGAPHACYNVISSEHLYAVFTTVLRARMQPVDKVYVMDYRGLMLQFKVDFNNDAARDDQNTPRSHKVLSKQYSFRLTTTNRNLSSEQEEMLTDIFNNYYVMMSIFKAATAAARADIASQDGGIFTTTSRHQIPVSTVTFSRVERMYIDTCASKVHSSVVEATKMLAGNADDCTCATTTIHNKVANVIHNNILCQTTICKTKNSIVTAMPNVEYMKVGLHTADVTMARIICPETTWGLHILNLPNDPQAVTYAIQKQGVFSYFTGFIASANLDMFAALPVGPTQYNDNSVTYHLYMHKSATPHAPVLDFTVNKQDLSFVDITLDNLPANIIKVPRARKVLSCNLVISQENTIVQVLQAKETINLRDYNTSLTVLKFNNVLDYRTHQGARAKLSVSLAAARGKVLIGLDSTTENHVSAYSVNLLVNPPVCNITDVGSLQMLDLHGNQCGTEKITGDATSRIALFNYWNNMQVDRYTLLLNQTDHKDVLLHAGKIKKSEVHVHKKVKHFRYIQQLKLSRAIETTQCELTEELLKHFYFYQELNTMEFVFNSNILSSDINKLFDDLRFCVVHIKKGTKEQLIANSLAYAQVNYDETEPVLKIKPVCIIDYLDTNITTEYMLNWRALNSKLTSLKAVLEACIVDDL